MKHVVLIGTSALLGLLVLFVAGKRAEAPVVPLSDTRAAAQTEAERGDAVLAIGESTIFVHIADTEEERVLGLGKREFLAEDEGMLFVFERSDAHGIWMKDMWFPIDILWLRETSDNTGCEGTEPAKQEYSCLIVVDMREDIAPESYPEVFRPKEETSYVLEVNGSAARRVGLRIGSFLILKR